MLAGRIPEDAPAVWDPALYITGSYPPHYYTSNPPDLERSSHGLDVSCPKRVSQKDDPMNVGSTRLDLFV
ncbi:hypothetical protein MN608_00094 [Microdochium nivale]|nr:hypothetical protein MN608_00094 [Microdochium nivale]